MRADRWIVFALALVALPASAKLPREVGRAFLDAGIPLNRVGIVVQETTSLQPLFAFDPEAHLPYTQQWNATIRHQLASTTLVSVAYVGTAGTHLLGLINVNQPAPGLSLASLSQRRPFFTQQAANCDS